MLNFVMVLHCHQPVGNFDSVFEMALKRCYFPIFEHLKAHPGVRVGLHISGPLLEWFEHYSYESLDILNQMADRNQIELLSGGFFEPLLAAIPVRDARGQVLLMNEYIAGQFGREPTGFWLTERVWDPGLPKILKGTGMVYTVVDDTHLYYAGLKPDEIYGPYMTEKEGYTLNLLATPMVMRYLIPFKTVGEVMNHLKAQEESGRELALYGDDGEKLGLWPGTHDWVIKEGWLEKFFSAIEESSDWLSMLLPGEYISSSQPLGRVYLPQASYEEMTEWALPSDRAYVLEKIITTLKNEGRWDEWRPFVRGGCWDNFLVKYEESNRMHKKMIFLSELVNDNKEAREHLWRAQCNCAYWHGVFGGLYLGHLRRAIHENLIKAHTCLIEESDEKISLIRHDVDKDGHEELLVWNKRISLGIAPARGGGIFEVCYLPLCANLSDTLTRKPEAYHNDINKIQKINEVNDEGISSIHDLPQSNNESLEKLIVYDTYTRISLLDHFLGKETTLEGYAVNDYSEEGDFLKEKYDAETRLGNSEEAEVKLFRRGFLKSSLLNLIKRIRIGTGACVKIDYEFENCDSNDISTIYGCEFNLNLYSDKDPEKYLYFPDRERRREVPETGKEDNLTLFELVNNSDGLTLTFEFSDPLSVWFSPIMTVSKSEEGFEHTYQGSSLLFLFPMNLIPGQKKGLGMKLHFIE